ncbi:MAG: hypothetical protein FWC62_01720, partial [Firmicutes bacterium]|nr:hypothetical protein [Bacillota bacterium]
MSDSTITRIAEQNAGKIALIKENREVLNAVRRLKTGDKSALAEAAGVSWPKLNKDIGDLEKENAVQMGARDSGQIYEVNSNFAFFVGLSITNDSIKLSICDFSLQPLTRDDLSARGFSHLHQMLPFSETGENNHVVSFGVTTELRAIIGKVNEIIGILLAEESANFHLLGITIAFAGFIDYKSRVFAFSPHVQKLNETPLDDLVLPAVKESLDNRNIFLYYENDSESAVLYEKESLFFSEDKDRRDLRNKENIGCIYISAGIGLGL